jgi:4-hydroxy-tetrahydrodipicolinate synthase
VSEAQTREIGHRPFAGALPAVITPCDERGEPDEARLVSHCLWLLDQGCDGLVVFGTTGQGNSFTVPERRRLLEKLAGRGIPAEKLMVGAGACAAGNAIELSKAAVAAGAGGVLLLPPFYYKEVTVDGLFAYFAEVIEKVGSDKLRVYLYHIPPISQVGIPLALVERLIAAYPKTVVGIKDSSGDWANTRALLENFPGFGVFAGSERYLLDTLRGGGAGCISAVANVLAGPICRVTGLWRSGAPDAELEAAQAATLFVREALQGLPMVPALHAIHAYYRGDEGFFHLRPPLSSMGAGSLERLFGTLDEAHFSLADIATVTGRFRIVPI